MALLTFSLNTTLSLITFLISGHVEEEEEARFNWGGAGIGASSSSASCSSPPADTSPSSSSSSSSGATTEAVCLVTTTGCKEESKAGGGQKRAGSSSSTHSSPLRALVHPDKSRRSFQTHGSSPDWGSSSSADNPDPCGCGCGEGRRLRKPVILKAASAPPDTSACLWLAAFVHNGVNWDSNALFPVAMMPQHLRAQPMTAREASDSCASAADVLVSEAVDICCWLAFKKGCSVRYHVYTCGRTRHCNCGRCAEARLRHSSAEQTA